MEFGKNIGETREEKITKLVNQKIEKYEKRAGKKIENERVVKFFEIAERKVKRQENRRRALIAILGALGITVGSVAMLNSGNEPKEVKKEVDMDTMNNAKKVKEFREGIKTEVKDTIQKESFINSILQKYNSNLPNESKIEKDDLGIILQENMGEGNVLGQVLKNGDIKYKENVSAALYGDIKEDEYWVPADAIDKIYVLVDNNSHNTIAGVGSIGDSAEQYTELTIENIQINKGDHMEKYSMNPNSYVQLESIKKENNIDTKEIYNKFEEYYNERNEKINSKNDKALEIE